MKKGSCDAASLTSDDGGILGIYFGTGVGGMGTGFTIPDTTHDGRG